MSLPWSSTAFSSAETLGPRAVLAGLVEERLLGGAELALLRRHELAVVLHGLLLRRDRLVPVVREGLEHVGQDVLDLAGPRRVLLLERRLTVELLPVHLRHVEGLGEEVRVAL